MRPKVSEILISHAQFSHYSSKILVRKEVFISSKTKFTLATLEQRIIDKL